MHTPLITLHSCTLHSSCGCVVSTSDGLQVRWFDPDVAPTITMTEGPAVNRQYGNGDVLPWQDETLRIQKDTHSQLFYDNLAAAIREGADLLVTPESAGESVRVLEICRKQNPHVTS